LYLLTLGIFTTKGIKNIKNNNNNNKFLNICTLCHYEVVVPDQHEDQNTGKDVLYSQAENNGVSPRDLSSHHQDDKQVPGRQEHSGNDSL